jgi:peptidylprolyl isomerase
MQRDLRMQLAKQGDLVTVHYTGRLSDGSVFDSSDGSEPLKFVLGKGHVIPGFDAAVEGMAAGQNKTVTIPMNKAYGPRHEQMLISLPRAKFPAGQDPAVGQRLHLQAADGRVVAVTVSAVTAETVSMDANHPLAGKDLTFDLRLTGISEDDGSCDHQCCGENRDGEGSCCGDHGGCGESHDGADAPGCCCGKHK